LLFLWGDCPAAVPPPPQVARELFGAKLPQVKIYAELLVGPVIERGLIGPAEAERIWERHLVNCGAIAELVPLTRTGSLGRPQLAPQERGEPKLAEGKLADQKPAERRLAEHPGSPRPGEEPVELADIGSGAGLPGIVLAIMLPQIRVILVEPLARRTAFLLECAAELGLDNVEVRRARAEGSRERSMRTS
jgi:16S rRNA (guanine527-N7)-methyltransferase